jgi:hypothetical protein
LSITIDDVKDRLLTLDDVRERLSYTEPLVTHEFEVGTGVSFRVQDEFNHGLSTLQGPDAIPAWISVGGRELQLTRDGFYDALGAIKLPKGFAEKAPSNIIEDSLNYFFHDGGLGKGEFKVLGFRGDKAGAIARGAVQPYSNLRFLEIALDAIERKYGEGEVFADYKFVHTLQQTHLRLIVPEYVRTIVNTGTENDTWSTGLQIINSLTGKEQTSINGYLFRYWCTNGAIDTRTSANSTWSRRGAVGQGEQVFEWARDAVDEVLDGLEGSLDAVQAMTEVSIEGSAAEALEDVFKEYKIPGGLRTSIIRNMINEDNMTAYSLMQAVTQAANSADLAPADVDRLMRVGGYLPTVAEEGRCDSDHPCGRFLAHAH